MKPVFNNYSRRVARYFGSFACGLAFLFVYTPGFAFEFWEASAEDFPPGPTWEVPKEWRELGLRKACVHYAKHIYGHPVGPKETSAPLIEAITARARWSQKHCELSVLDLENELFQYWPPCTSLYSREGNRRAIVNWIRVLEVFRQIAPNTKLAAFGIPPSQEQQLCTSENWTPKNEAAWFLEMKALLTALVPYLDYGLSSAYVNWDDQDMLARFYSTSWALTKVELRKPHLFAISTRGFGRYRDQQQAKYGVRLPSSMFRWQRDYIRALNPDGGVVLWIENNGRALGAVDGGPNMLVDPAKIDGIHATEAQSVFDQVVGKSGECVPYKAHYVSTGWVCDFHEWMRNP